MSRPVAGAAAGAAEPAGPARGVPAGAVPAGALARPAGSGPEPRGATADPSERLPARSRDRSVPGRLQLLRVVAAAVVLSWAALTATQLVLSWRSTQAAVGDVEQLIRVQDIKVELLRADALATNAFLVGGLEPSEQRAAYDTAVAAASADITAAARAQPADEAVLTELGRLVVGYAGTMELARANNRQGFPVGAAYLADASTLLRTRGLALVDALVEANTARSHDSLASQHPWWLVTPGILGLAGLVWINQWVAQRFRRRVNVGVGLAALAVALLTVAATAAANAQSSENDTLQSGTFRTVVAGAHARGAANLAKSAESLRLIARGSGAAQEQAWQEQARSVTEHLKEAGASAGLVAEWTAYAQAHAALVAKDAAGDWDGAVSDATTAGPERLPAKFAAFDHAAGDLVTFAGKETTRALDAGSWAFLAWTGLAVLAGLAGAGLAWRGLTQRLEEFG